MEINAIIKKANPASAEAKQMAGALWQEIQDRYGFIAPNPFDPTLFSTERAGFWIAFGADERPIGSIAVAPVNANEAEIDIMYVLPHYRGGGIAQELMNTLVKHSKEKDFHVLKLRAGAPQPEALRFYEKEGFIQIPAFGKWVDDSTAICFEKQLV